MCRLDHVGIEGGESFTDSDAFWGYWRGTGGGWSWSSTGAASTVVEPGDVEGWSWGTGRDGSTHPAPPATPYASACGGSSPSPDPGGGSGGGGDPSAGNGGGNGDAATLHREGAADDGEPYPSTGGGAADAGGGGRATDRNAEAPAGGDERPPSTPASSEPSPEPSPVDATPLAAAPPDRTGPRSCPWRSPAARSRSSSSRGGCRCVDGREGRHASGGVDPVGHVRRPGRLSTTNPLYLLPLIAVAWFVNAVHRRPGPTARSFRTFLLFGLGAMTVRTALVFFGTVDASSVAYAFLEGLRLAVLLIVFGTFNAVTDPFAVLRLAPRRFHEPALAAALALSIAPRTIQAAGRVREAQQLRGSALRGGVRCRRWPCRCSRRAWRKRSPSPRAWTPGATAADDARATAHNDGAWARS